MSKIQPTHLARAAYVYIRQSTMTQVHRNVESQRRQYALVERAKPGESGGRDAEAPS